MNDSKIDRTITPQMIPSETQIGKCPPNSWFNQTIFKPTNTSTTPSPYFSR